jgi:hypothetical protein
MVIKIINNCSKFVGNEYGIIESFLDFCNKSHPLKKQLEVVLLNHNSTKHEEDSLFKIHVITNNKNISEIIRNISEKWVNLFAIQRKIKITNQESELAILKFIEIYPQFSNQLK